MVKVNKLILIGRYLGNNHKIITYGLEIPDVDMKNIMEYQPNILKEVFDKGLVNYAQIRK